MLQQFPVSRASPTYMLIKFLFVLGALSPQALRVILAYFIGVVLAKVPHRRYTRCGGRNVLQRYQFMPTTRRKKLHTAGLIYSSPGLTSFSTPADVRTLESYGKFRSEISYFLIDFLTDHNVNSQ